MEEYYEKSRLNSRLSIVSVLWDSAIGQISSQKGNLCTANPLALARY